MEKFLNSRILVVDDEPANIFFLKGILAGEGYKVITASSGMECLEILNDTRPDVILLDIMMPVITGIEVLEKIQKNENTKNIPVIMVTAKTESTDVEEALDKGAVEYIKKPIDEIELLARLRTTLRIKKYEDALRDMLQSKKDFINVISQDLRVPFSSISGFAEMLYYDKELVNNLNSYHRNFLKYIINTSQNIVDYFNKLLNWTNLEGKEIKLHLDEINLLKLINSSVVVYQTMINEKKIKLINEVDENLIVKVDKTYFRQVINNLISNAVKFTPDSGEIKITSIKDNNNIKLIISDTGLGIQDIEPEVMFGRFINTPARGTRGEQGTGLGLGICKKILDAHGFDITYKTEPREGTDFIITMYG
jgi:two-component system sensor histidine kinase/response regulator